MSDGARYDFLREPLSPGLGYAPDMHTGGPGAFVEPVLRAEFGDWGIEVPAGDEDLAVLQKLHALAEATWRGAIDTIEAVRLDDDPSLNADGRLKIVGGIVEPKLQALATTAAREFARVTSAIEQVREDIGKAVRSADQIDIALHADIRAYLRAPGDGGSAAKVSAVIANRDRPSLQAIVTAPAYMVGLPADHESLARARAALAELMAPGLVKRESTLREALALTDRALKSLDRKVSRTIDFKKAAALRSRTKDHSK